MIGGCCAAFGRWVLDSRGPSSASFRRASARSASSKGEDCLAFVGC